MLIFFLFFFLRIWCRETVDQQAAVIAETLLSTAKKQQASELDLSALASRKPNADLKRELTSKMEELEKLTKIKIAEHIRTGPSFSSLII